MPFKRRCVFQVAVWHCAETAGGEPKLAGKLEVPDSATAIHAAPISLQDNR